MNQSIPMSDISISMIVAIGKNRQIGLNGKLPWLKDPSFKNEVSADLEEFRKNTTGGLVIVGHNTWPSVKNLHKTYSRSFLCDDTSYDIETMVNRIKTIAAIRYKVFPYSKPNIWIAGGSKTYERWWKYINYVYVSELSYDGEADTYLPEYMLENASGNRLLYITYYY